MIKTICLIFFALISFSVSGQTITLMQQKSDSDLAILNGSYTIYMKKVDLLAGIAHIDSVFKTKHWAMARLLRSGTLRSVNFISPQHDEMLMVDLLRENLGCYLLLRGKAAILKNGKPLKEVIADRSPEMRDLDGTATVAIAFSEDGDGNSVFMGQIRTELGD